jgi:hypothetical protein
MYFLSPVQMLLCVLLCLALTHARAARVYLLDDGIEDQGEDPFNGQKKLNCPPIAGFGFILGGLILFKDWVT